METPQPAILPAKSRKFILEHNIHVPLFLLTNTVAALLEMTKTPIIG
jgi:hypothetical protein